MESTALGERIAAVLAIDPSGPAIEFGGRWRTWGEVGSTVESLAAHLPVAGTRVGVLLRNRPAQVALLLGSLRAGAWSSRSTPRGAEGCRDRVARASCVAGEPEIWPGWWAGRQRRRSRFATSVGRPGLRAVAPLISDAPASPCRC
jgi:hypothetical protein